MGQTTGPRPIQIAIRRDVKDNTLLNEIVKKIFNFSQQQITDTQRDLKNIDTKSLADTELDEESLKKVLAVEKKEKEKED